VSPSGCAALLSAVAAHPALKELSLEWNRLGAAGGLALGEVPPRPGASDAKKRPLGRGRGDARFPRCAPCRSPFLFSVTFKTLLPLTIPIFCHI
jgi:hypothetical protein